MSSVTVDRNGKKKKSTAIKRAAGDVVFDVINVTLICIMLALFIYPIWYTIAVSFAEPAEAAAGTSANPVRDFCFLFWKIAGRIRPSRVPK